MTGPSFTSKLLNTFQKQKVTPDLALKPGQVLSGKVTKLYPDQRALIQLGTQQITAQLETALKLDSRYWFQVVSSGQKVHMKVLPDKPGHAPSSGGSIDQLLSILGWKPNKDRVHLLRDLFKQGIPHKQEQIQKALRLYEKDVNKQGSREILLEILNRSLPLTESVYQAVKMRSTTTFSEQLSGFAGKAGDKASMEALASRLATFRKGETATPIEVLMHRAISESDRGVSSLFTLLQKTEAIPSSVNFPAWQESWNQWKNTDGKNIVHLPYGVAEKVSVIIDGLMQINQKQLPVSHTLKEKFVDWVSLLQKTAGQGISNKESSQLNRLENQLIQQGVIDKLTGLLTESQQRLLSNWMGNVNRSEQSLSGITQMLQPFSNAQIWGTDEKVLVDLLTKMKLPVLQPKEQFMLELKHMLFFSGLSDEDLSGELNNNRIADLTERSLKELLALVRPEVEGKESRKVDSLLQFLAGMQLTAKQESDHFIQATLQFPASKLGVNHDIVIDFESKKESSGEINPDFCNILFYLELDNLGETVISMKIQKRIVQLTVFNDTAELDMLIPSLQPSLKQGLQKLNYELASIQRKEVHVKGQDIEPAVKASQTFNQGVDYRA